MSKNILCKLWKVTAGYAGDLVVDGRVIMRWYFRKKKGGFFLGTPFVWLRIERPMTEASIHSND
jgi:hypothetical protein